MARYARRQCAVTDKEPHLNVPVERGLCEIGGGHEHGLVVGHDGFGVQDSRRSVWFEGPGVIVHRRPRARRLAAAANGLAGPTVPPSHDSPKEGRPGDAHDRHDEGTVEIVVAHLTGAHRQVRILSGGIVRARDDSCNNAPGRPDPSLSCSCFFLKVATHSPAEFEAQ